MSHTVSLCNYDRIYKETGLIDGENILLYDSYEQLIEQIHRVCNNLNYAQQLGENAHQLYLNQYTETHFIQKLIEVAQSTPPSPSDP